MKCNHDKYKKPPYMTSVKALKEMRTGDVAWIGLAVKVCEDCGETLPSTTPKGNTVYYVPTQTAAEVVRERLT